MARVKSRNLDDPDTRSPMQLLVKQIVADPQKAVDRGNVDLGAALIDREIQRRAVDRHPHRAELIDLLDRSPQSARRLELACRESKEKFFRTRREELAASGRRVGVHYPLEMAGGEEFVVDLRLSVAEMDTVLEAPQAALGGRSWMRAFAEDVEKAVQSANGEVDLLLLTVMWPRSKPGSGRW